MRTLLLTLALLAPLVTGCLGDEAPAADATNATARTAAEAGAATGDAPVAPRESYALDGEATGRVTAHPARIETNAAKPPVELDLSDTFAPGDCRGLNFGPTEGVLTQASRPYRVHDLSEHLAVGDAFQYEIAFSYVSKESAWGEIHPAFGLGSTLRAHEESTASARGPIAVNWTGQGFRASEDEWAFVEVACWVGAMSEPVPYTLTVRLTFAEGAIPAEAPVLVPIPEGATRMFVRGLAFDPSRGVSSHFRLFGPDDTVVCECGLSSQDEVAVIPLADTRDHVLLVDHTDNGFVSIAFDAPPTRPLRALPTEWTLTPLTTGTGGPVDQTLDVDLPSAPLFMHAFVRGPTDGTPGGGKKTMVDVQNGRGTPLHIQWGGHLAMQMSENGGMWLGFWPGDWERAVDHHAFAPGTHVVHVKADALRGEVVLLTRHYVR